MIERIFRLLCFLIFFAIGSFAVALAMLAPEWKELYQLEAAVKQAEQSNKKIEEIIQDHQVLISQINNEPNILKRIVPVILGRQTEDPNQPVAKITADTFARARAVLKEESKNNPDHYQIPQWLQRCTTKNNRIILFIAGSGLVIVSFACFGDRKSTAKKQKENN